VAEVLYTQSEPLPLCLEFKIARNMTSRDVMHAAASQMNQDLSHASIFLNDRDLPYTQVRQSKESSMDILDLVHLTELATNIAQESYLDLIKFLVSAASAKSAKLEDDYGVSVGYMYSTLTSI